MKRWGWEKSIVSSVRNINNLKHLKYHISVIKHFFSGVWGKCRIEDEKIFKGEESIEILKFLRLINNT